MTDETRTKEEMKMKSLFLEFFRKKRNVPDDPLLVSSSPRLHQLITAHLSPGVRLVLIRRRNKETPRPDSSLPLESSSLSPEDEMSPSVCQRSVCEHRVENIKLNSKFC